MTAPRLVVRRPSCFGVSPSSPPEAHDGWIEKDFQEVKGWVLDGTILRHLLRYRDVVLLTHRIDHISKPFPTALLLRLLSRGRCSFCDDSGARTEVGARTLVVYLARFVSTLLRIPYVLGGLRLELRRFERTGLRRLPPPRRQRPPVYLRGDLVFGLKSGGSVGHVAGVLNNLGRFTGPPIFVTTSRMPTVRSDIETHVVVPGSDFCGFEEIPNFHFGRVLVERALELLLERPVSFVYQRYCFGSIAGLQLSHRLGVPFVLEYNGSEAWISDHWGRPLKHARLARRIEDVLISTADLVVVVSTPLADELRGRGVREDRILVDPNGVDEDRYSPAVDGTAVRAQHGLEAKRVVGFIGTFGRWHGAEVLADAFGRLMKRRPDWQDDVRLMMIGDGLTRPEVVARLDQHEVRDLAVLTGLVAQEDGPAHLAACDLLISPHVRNRDGSPFFGSPTKLFEYMAMGKGIIASGLDQIGEVLGHERTALLVEPGDVDALVAAMERLLDDPALARRLGEAARAEAVAQHSWREHTRRIVEAVGRNHDGKGAVGAPSANDKGRR